jgi:peptidoglycan/LPS O-acetylase OafA/YrhL
MVHLFVEMMVSRLYGPVLTHLARLIKSMVSLQTVDLILGFVFTLFTVLVVLLLSKVSYQWIEHPFQLKFRDLARVYFPENSPPPVQNDLAAAK